MSNESNDIYHPNFKWKDEGTDTGSKCVINPISFSESNVDRRDGRTGTLNDYLPEYHESKIYQNDPLQRYQLRASYELQRNEIELQKQEIHLAQRLDFEKKLCDMRIRCKAYLEGLSCTVYMDSSGTLMYALTGVDQSKITTKRLLNVEQYKSRLYVSFYPQLVRYLEVSWEGDGRTGFHYGEEGIFPKDFLKKLKAKGVRILLSGRSEKQAADALLSFSIYSAEIQEISFRHGWTRMKDGKWHFASGTEITMQEVENGI